MDIKMINMEHNLIDTVYNISKHLDFTFNKITDHANLYYLNISPINKKRKVQFTYGIFQKSRAYLDSLKKWNARQKTNKTYIEMKICMREERQSITVVEALTVKDSLNQVQMILSL